MDDRDFEYHYTEVPLGPITDEDTNRIMIPEGFMLLQVLSVSSGRASVILVR